MFPVFVYAQQPQFNYELKFFQRNDTIFRCYVYIHEKIIDSIIVNNFYSKVTCSKWISQKYEDESYYISKFKKIKDSKWLKKNNEKYYQFDCECVQKSFKLFYKDGSVEIVRDRGLFYTRKIVTPKK